jgi:hypothetical protein
MCSEEEKKRQQDYQASTGGHQTAENKSGLWGGCRRGNPAHLTHPLAHSILKQVRHLSTCMVWLHWCHADSHAGSRLCSSP